MVIFVTCGYTLYVFGTVIPSTRDLSLVIFALQPCTASQYSHDSMQL